MKASCTFTRPNDTTPYNAGDVVGGLLQFIGGEVPTQTDLYVTTTDLMVFVSSVPSGMTSFRLHLYNTRPAAIADNAVWDLPSGDRSIYRGYIDLGTPVDVGSTLYVETTQQNKHYRMPAQDQLFGYLVTNGAYTPTAEAVKKINIHMVPLN